MLVTITAPTPGLAARGKFEAMKYGLPCEPMADNTIEISVGTIDKAQIICAKMGGQITSVIPYRKDTSNV